MINYRIHHNRKKKLKEDGTALVQIEIYKGNTRKYISTGISIQPSEWDEKTLRVSRKNSRSEEYNVILDDLTYKIVSVLRKAKLMEKDLSIEEVLELMNHDDSNSLSDFITIEVEKDNRLKEKTKKDLLNTRNRLNEFNSEVKIQDVDYKFIVDLDNHLRSMGYSINTIGKLHKNLKRFLNLAIKYKLMTQDDYPYRNFKVERESTAREALSLKEVYSLEALNYDCIMSD